MPSISILIRQLESPDGETRQAALVQIGDLAAEYSCLPTRSEKGAGDWDVEAGKLIEKLASFATRLGSTDASTGTALWTLGKIIDPRSLFAVADFLWRNRNDLDDNTTYQGLISLENLLQISGREKMPVLAKFHMNDLLRLFEFRGPQRIAEVAARLRTDLERERRRS